MKLIKDEIIKRHENYNIDTDAEGKYIEDSSNWNRYLAIKENVPTQSIMLDVGCNSGGLLRRLTNEKNIVPYGIDIAKHMVKKAQQKGIIADVGNAEERMPYADEFFDVCCATEIFEHVYDDKECFKRCIRVLKKGGIFITTVPHPQSYNTKKCSIQEHLYHVRNYNRKKLYSLIRFGLKNIRFKDIYKTEYAFYNNNPLYDKPSWIFAVGVKK